MPTDQHKHVEKNAAQGWAPDVIVGRQEKPIDCPAFNDEFDHLGEDTISARNE